MDNPEQLLSEEVEYMITELLETNVIPRKEIKILKEEKLIFLDPNLVMQERHKEISNQKLKRVKEHTSFSNKASHIPQKKDDIKEAAIFNSAVKKLEEDLKKERKLMLEENKISKQFQSPLKQTKIVKKEMKKEHNKNQIDKDVSNSAESYEQQLEKNKECTENCFDSLRSLSVTPETSGKSGYASSCDSGFNEYKSNTTTWEEIFNSGSVVSLEYEDGTPKFPNLVKTNCAIEPQSPADEENKMGLQSGKDTDSSNDLVREKKMNAFFLKLQRQIDADKEKMNLNESKTINNGNEEDTIPVSQNKITKAVKKPVVSRYGMCFQQRFKVQKEIIEKQKKELQEQNKKIESLLKECQERHDAISNTKQSIKKNEETKTKCIMKEKIKQVNSDKPAFLVNMEKRTEERKRHRARLKELIEKREEEKQIKEIKEKEERRRKEEERKIIELQEEQMAYLKKLIKEENEKKERENLNKAENILANMYRKMLLSKGIKAFKISLYEYKNNIQIAQEFYKVSLLKRMLNEWRLACKVILRSRINKADEFYKKKLKRKCFSVFKKNHKEYVELKQVADDYRDLNLVIKGFRSWIIFKKMENQRMLELTSCVIRYRERKLKRIAFNALKNFPKLMFMKREEEKRLSQLAEKVKEVIPDFVIDYNNF